MNNISLNQEPPVSLPRILSVIPAEEEGASFIFAKRQVASLQSNGIRNNTFFVTSRTSLLALVKGWQRLRREIRMFKPDIIHAHYGTVNAFLCMIATNLPLVVTFRGCDLTRTHSISWLRSAVGRLLSQIAALRARRIICVSDQLKGQLWWRKSRAIVIPTGIDTTIFYPRSRDEARSELKWEKKERVVLFNAGNAQIRKRLDLARSAVDTAMTIYGEIHFEVLDGSQDPDIIPTIMNAADCLLCTSDSEGSPNIVKEALACNLPVVSVDVGDVRERLAGVKLSRIVERDKDKIGRAIAEVLMKGGRSNGYEAIRKLSLDRITTCILAIYLEVIREK